MLRPRIFCANAFSRTGYTFASPFAIDADQLTALGITAVKQLGTSSFSEGVLTLNFTDATAIEAGMTIPGLEIPGIPSSILMGK